MIWHFLQTAALFLYAGFLTQTDGHSATSCELVNKYLPKFDYTSDDIMAIYSAIMATKIPQTPTNKLSEIFCDADLLWYK